MLNLRYATRLATAGLNSTLIVLRGFEGFVWTALGISWFGGVLLALAYLHQGALGWLGRFVCAAVLVLAWAISYSTTQRWVKIAPGAFGGSVLIGLLNYSSSGITWVEAASLITAMVLCALFSSGLDRRHLGSLDRIVLATGLMCFFNALMDREWLFAWLLGTVVLFAIPVIAQKQGLRRRSVASIRQE